MSWWSGWLAVLVLALGACVGSRGSQERDAGRLTTAGALAIANLDHEIARFGDAPETVELLLARSRFLGDYEALARAVAIAEARAESGDDYLRRARTRGAEHRFGEALADVAVAEGLGADRVETGALRASILVATGRARQVLPQLEAEAVRHPGFASRSALASAYAMLGRLAEADSQFVAALAGVRTTSPFPYAWVQFARGVMWAEHGADTARAVALYERALVHLPQFTAASVHLAELEAARGELGSALARVEPVARASGEPEAIALLGTLYVRLGDTTRGHHEIERAGLRFESLLARHPMAVADHAAEFYLGPGGDPERAWRLARRNVAARCTPRALALAVRAASAAGHRREACTRAGALAGSE